MSELNKKTRVIIVGGGFMGIEVALGLLKKGKNLFEITLISDKDYFEYYPAMYRVVTGSFPIEVKIPLSKVLARFGAKISLIKDTIIDIDPVTKTAKGKLNEYSGDVLVLALGGENVTYSVPEISDISYSFRSVDDAINLKNRIKKFALCDTENPHNPQIHEKAHFIIVGGGPSGVELAGELDYYLGKLFYKNKRRDTSATIELIDRSPRILGKFDEKVSMVATKRLQDLGITVSSNIVLNNGTEWLTYLEKYKPKNPIIIWTAGVRPLPMCRAIPGVVCNEQNGRLKVNEYLEALNCRDMYLGGDIGDTPMSGLAQTAIYDGKFIASVLVAKAKNEELPKYENPFVAHSIPIGPNWALFAADKKLFYGFFMWLFRMIIDFRYYNSIVPTGYALKIFWAAIWNKKDTEIEEKA